ncbi:hypothetical protein ABEY52_26800 [Priestia aryabhattai]
MKNLRNIKGIEGKEAIRKQKEKDKKELEMFKRELKKQIKKI